jgi:hypothetical protein
MDILYRSRSMVESICSPLHQFNLVYRALSDEPDAIVIATKLRIVAWQNDAINRRAFLNADRSTERPNSSPFSGRSLAYSLRPSLKVTLINCSPQ